MIVNIFDKFSKWDVHAILSDNLLDYSINQRMKNMTLTFAYLFNNKALEKEQFIATTIFFPLKMGSYLQLSRHT